MCPNSRFKTIKRCKKVTTPNGIFMHRCKHALLISKTTERGLFVATPHLGRGYYICNEILQLIRITDPRQNWWRDDPVFKNGEPTHVYYFYHPGNWNDLPLKQPRTIHAGYQAFVVGHNLPNYYHTSKQFIQLPSTGSNKYDHKRGG
ncbi:hypothetical protein B9Z19DRAFT_1068542 [Tuber borchii]|uniref:Uncharacterized protein n=1 Tax=Tuber borchii TaxID=42251 RepID=A0A2T6ZEV6_TUBBO|nr:hypothetical protein B9Z19DRAFT_1068542 [Tuber borchii]